MFVVDTNVLVYAADQHCEEHVQCRGLIEKWRQQASPWYLSWGIIYEFLRVSTHPRVFRNPWRLGEAWAFVEAVLASESASVLVATPKHASVARLVISEVSGLKGNLLHDAHTAVLMREHGIRRIFTRDNDLHRFPFLEVVDPMVADLTA